MNQAKYDRVLRGQTVSAVKVLGSVSAITPMTARQVASDLGMKGCHLQFNVIEGCLNSLTSDGLLREERDGLFLKVVPKRIDHEHPEPVSNVSTFPALGTVSKATHEQQIFGEAASGGGKGDNLPKPFPSALERLAEAAERARELGKRMEALQTEIASLAATTEDVALQVDDELKKAREGDERLRQFAASLKALQL